MWTVSTYNNVFNTYVCQLLKNLKKISRILSIPSLMTELKAIFYSPSLYFFKKQCLCSYNIHFDYFKILKRKTQQLLAWIALSTTVCYFAVVYILLEYLYNTYKLNANDVNWYTLLSIHFCFLYFFSRKMWKVEFIKIYFDNAFTDI